MSFSNKRYQPMPDRNTTVLDESGRMTQAWHMWGVNLWQKAGGIYSSVTSAVFLSLTGSTVEMHNAQTGESLGVIPTIGLVGQAPIPQTLTVSPFTFVAGTTGTLFVDSAQVEIRRGSTGIWYLAGVAGGQFPVLPTDQVRVSWFRGDPPGVVFFPTGIA